MSGELPKKQSELLEWSKSIKKKIAENVIISKKEQTLYLVCLVQQKQTRQQQGYSLD